MSEETQADVIRETLTAIVTHAVVKHHELMLEARTNAPEGALVPNVDIVVHARLVDNGRAYFVGGGNIECQHELVELLENALARARENLAEAEKAHAAKVFS